uniref:WAP domain-containing protein n=1 Tax=Mus spicilegus TaxID=10103 RepID=A0A8C6MRZ6_MUSSI
MKTATVLFLVALIAVGMNTTYAVSSPKKFEKHGTCPKWPTQSFGDGFHACAEDESCPKDQKCCNIEGVFLFVFLLL